MTLGDAEPEVTLGADAIRESRLAHGLTCISAVVSCQ